MSMVLVDTYQLFLNVETLKDMDELTAEFMTTVSILLEYEHWMLVMPLTTVHDTDVNVNSFGMVIRRMSPAVWLEPKPILKVYDVEAPTVALLVNTLRELNDMGVVMVRVTLLDRYY